MSKQTVLLPTFSDEMHIWEPVELKYVPNVDLTPEESWAKDFWQPTNPPKSVALQGLKTVHRLASNSMNNVGQHKKRRKKEVFSGNAETLHFGIFEPKRSDLSFQTVAFVLRLT